MTVTPRHATPRRRRRLTLERVKQKNRSGLKTVQCKFDSDALYDLCMFHDQDIDRSLQALECG